MTESPWDPVRPASGDAEKVADHDHVGRVKIVEGSIAEGAERRLGAVPSERRSVAVREKSHHLGTDRIPVVAVTDKDNLQAAVRGRGRAESDQALGAGWGKPMVVDAELGEDFVVASVRGEDMRSCPEVVAGDERFTLADTYPHVHRDRNVRGESGEASVVVDPDDEIGTGTVDGTEVGEGDDLMAEVGEGVGEVGLPRAWAIS